MTLTTGPDGIEVMHYFERCKLMAYPDPASPLFRALVKAGIDPYNLAEVPVRFAGIDGAPWTLGFGCTGPDIACGSTCTQERANSLFAERLAREFEPGVRGALDGVPTQCEFDALVAFAFNVGMGAFRGSTVLRKHNEGDGVAAADAFRLWVKAGGKTMKGLQRRREAERGVYLGRAASDAIALALKSFP